VIRNLGPEDLARCLELSTAAHWNQESADWAYFLEHAHCYGVELPGAGVAGTTVAWDVAPNITWIAMVLVDSFWRGRGLARQLMQHAIVEGETRGMAAALDATELGEPVYAKMGFAGEDCLVRLKRERAGGDVTSLAGSNVQPLTESDWDDVVRLDEVVSGLRRDSMLRMWASRLPEAAWGLRSDDGKLTGFVLGRPGRVADQVGPLVAPDEAAAADLLHMALGACRGAVYVDVPLVHEGLRAGLAERGFHEERGFRRMSRPAQVFATNWAKCFAIAGPDFA
jgi:GNAT superfamily N-acetyltransferase